MRRRLLFLFGILLVALVAFAFLNWNDAALPGEALPPPFDEWAAPDVPMNAAVYVAPQRPSAVTIRGADGREATGRVVRFEGVAVDPVREYAGRVEFVDAAEASVAALALEAGIWRRAEGRTLLFGKPDNAWAETVHVAWTGEDRLPWAERDPAARHGWLLLPDAPLSPLLALGFIRNREDVLDRTLAELGLGVGGLGTGLRFARVDLVSFGLYGEFGEAPSVINADVLRGMGAGIIVVAESSYPAFIVGLLWGRIVSAAGLEAVALGGEEAHYRSLDDEWHLMAKRYGRTLYFFVEASRGEVEKLALSVVQSQRARRGG
ncbi:MAG: hypothetical protein OXL97_03100 [Chloroflexota bacterium]|nr:hypothetical protein [Chloroflexota bacterium]MDE2885475.1 hypothetical protein [Chloroflexota bacterium]